jgi:hypothetical protein
MITYDAFEFNADSMEETGVIETYQANNIFQAVEKCLYTHSLKNGKTFIGPTGRVVYCGNLFYSIVPARAKLERIA